MAKHDVETIFYNEPFSEKRESHPYLPSTSGQRVGNEAPPKTRHSESKQLLLTKSEHRLSSPNNFTNPRHSGYGILGPSFS